MNSATEAMAPPLQMAWRNFLTTTIESLVMGLAATMVGVYMADIWPSAIDNTA